MNDEGKDIANAEFNVHVLTPESLEVMKVIAAKFDRLLCELHVLGLVESRELSLVHTKLEEACFYAKKCYASHNCLLDESANG